MNVILIEESRIRRNAIKLKQLFRECQQELDAYLNPVGGTFGAQVDISDEEIAQFLRYKKYEIMKIVDIIANEGL